MLPWPDQGRAGTGRRAALAVVLLCLLPAAGPGRAAPAAVDSLRAVLADMPPDTNRVLALHQLAVELYFAHSDSAFAPAYEAEHLARQHNFWRGIMLGLYAQGLARWGGGQYEEALTKYAQALELAVALDAKPIRFKLVNNMGVVYNVMGDQAAALKAYHECLDLAPRVGAERHVPLILMNIGNIYAYVDDHERALEYFQEALAKLGDPRAPLAASLWKNAARMQVNLGRSEDAVRSARRSVDLRRGMGDPALAAASRSVLAEALLAAGHVDSAAVLVAAALPVLQGLPDPGEYLDGLVLKARIELARYDVAAARATLADAMAVESGYGSPRQRRVIYGLTSRAEHLLGNESAEAHYASRYVALVDSLGDVSRVREIARLETEFDARLRLARLEERRSADVRFALVTGGGVLLLLASLARLYQVQKRLNRSLNVRNDELEREVAARTGDLRDLSQHLVRLREDERRRIARDIHDDLSQALTAIRLSLSHLRMKNADPGLEPVLERTSDMAAAALKESSRLIRDLRPLALEELGLPGAIRWLADRHRAQTGADVVVDVAEVEACDEDRTLALFRIAQEALQNVLKHAGAREVIVRLAPEAGAISLTVTDDGRGMGAPGEGRRSYGLLGMQEAARAVGGTVSVTTGPGEGTRVLALIPC